MMILFSSQKQLSQASGHLYVSNPEYNENLLHDNSAALGCCTLSLGVCWKMFPDHVVALSKMVNILQQ